MLVVSGSISYMYSSSMSMLFNSWWMLVSICLDTEDGDGEGGGSTLSWGVWSWGRFPSSLILFAKTSSKGVVSGHVGFSMVEISILSSVLFGCISGWVALLLLFFLVSEGGPGILGGTWVFFCIWGCLC